MRVRLLKRVGKWPFGTVMTVTNEKRTELADAAEDYTGEYPPRKKHKLNLSKLKA